MAIKVHDVVHDDVIKSTFALGQATYQFAIDKLVPLIGRFDEQRKKQSAKFYSRLREDILKGCVMPPITLAFVSKKNSTSSNAGDVQAFVNRDIKNGYILDGMQQLNTLYSASIEKDFPLKKTIYVNIIIAERYDFLLYRMITLNNGQKPMTPRHQIEILTQNLLDFSKFDNIVIQTEKDTEDNLVHGAFKLADISAAYTAYLTDNVNNQNNKIIDEKMNEILVGRVMGSNLTSAKAEFSEILGLVDEFSENKDAKRWLKLQNNLIGFTVGAKKSFDSIKQFDENEFATQVQKFEEAFDAINPSKVNVGRFRRELSQNFFENIDNYEDADSDEVAESFVDLTIND